MAAGAENLSNNCLEQKKAWLHQLQGTVANTTGDAHSVHHLQINLWVMLYPAFEKTAWQINDHDATSSTCTARV